MKKWFLLLIMAALLVLTACGKDNNRDTAGAARSDAGEGKATRVAIGTGAVAGLYYTTGSALARLLNSKHDTCKVHCTVEATGGSVFNVNALMAGDLEFGVVRSDRQYQAVNGEAQWAQKGPQKDLRSVFSIYPESVILVAAVDAGIQNINDLKGKRVYAGSPGSVRMHNAIDALAAAGINYDTDLKLEKVKTGEVSAFLQQGGIDAFFYEMVHPDAAVEEAVKGSRRVRFVPIVHIDSLLAKYPYYVKCIVPVKAYPGAQNSSDVATFGVKATLVTSARVPDQVVYAITRAVFENLEAFKKLNPAFSSLTAKSMLEGLSAPLHPGAKRYYQEAGLM